jgi:hypothetical protein
MSVWRRKEGDWGGIGEGFVSICVCFVCFFSNWIFYFIYYYGKINPVFSFSST